MFIKNSSNLFLISNSELLDLLKRAKYDVSVVSGICLSINFFSRMAACRDLLQTWHKFSSWGPDHLVFLLFMWIRKIQDEHPG